MRSRASPPCAGLHLGNVVFAHLRYRRYVEDGRIPASEFRLPGAPVSNWFVLAFLAMVLVLLAFREETGIALYVAPVWIAVMAIAHVASRSHYARLVPEPAPCPGVPVPRAD